MPLLSSEDADLELGKAVMQSLKAQKVKTHQKNEKKHTLLCSMLHKTIQNILDPFGSLYSLKCI